MNQVEKYLDTLGEKGSLPRLEAIASMDLGKRSDAARVVCEKRYRRRELMSKGLSYENSVLIVNEEYTLKI